MATKFPQVVTKTLLSTEDQIICAVTLQALDRVQSNYSFASANNDNEKFKQMFPIQRWLNLTNCERRKFNMLYSSKLLLL